MPRLGDPRACPQFRHFPLTDTAHWPIAICSGAGWGAPNGVLELRASPRRMMFFATRAAARAWASDIWPASSMKTEFLTDAARPTAA